MRCNHLSQMTRGWFVGPFTPAVLNTHACEAAVKHYKAGESEPRHTHRVADEITVVISGRIAMNEFVFETGDIIHVGPGESVEFRAVEDSVCAVVKVPGVPGDKYPG